MKFDLVVGNPPYGDSKKAMIVGPKKLYQLFAKKGFDYLKQNGILAFITPVSWFAPNKKDDPIKNILQTLRKTVQFDTIQFGDRIKNYFAKVGSSFCYFVMRNQSVTYLTTINQYEVELQSMPFLPLKVNHHTIAITKKLLSRSKFQVVEGSWTQHIRPFDGNDNTIKTQDTDHVYPVFHTNTQALWSRYPHLYQFSKKILWTESGYAKPVFDDGILGMSEMAFAILVDQPDSLMSILNSSVYRWLFKQWKWSGYNNRVIMMQYLPAFDLDHIWTDQQIYTELGLTLDEITEIEGTH